MDCATSDETSSRERACRSGLMVVRDWVSLRSALQPPICGRTAREAMGGEQRQFSPNSGAEVCMYGEAYY